MTSCVIQRLKALASGNLLHIIREYNPDSLMRVIGVPCTVNDSFTVLSSSSTWSRIAFWGFEYLRFVVNKNKTTDEDDEGPSKATVPFQIAYAVSIHKAQGLEYDHVKIIITDEIDELITHSIFYTAITRARESLKIYWTQPVEEKVLAQIKPQDHQKDVALLRQEIK